MGKGKRRGGGEYVERKNRKGKKEKGKGNGRA